MSSADPDDFAFLAADAAAVGADGPLPPVTRVSLTDEVSALSWGDAPATVALAHGAALNAHTWDATLLAWLAGSPASPHGLLAIDLPGHGDSPWRDDGVYAPDRIAPAVGDALAAAVGDGLLAPGFTLIGHSLGGLTGLELLRTGRASFRRLVLVDILPLPPDAARTVAAFLDGPASFASRAEIVERALAFGFGGARDALERGVALNTRTTPDGRVVWKHHLGQLGARGMPPIDAEALWPVVASAPVGLDLVLAEQSLVDGPTLRRFEELRPESSVQRLAGGHNLQEDAPGPLAAVFASLLDAPNA
ncbi:alpha/beta hydrolase [Propionicicella superfundia]|uniref:alpha/beta hydrolase n=1 Tax=Propionicicella superfundia TaxID=348582 RepID=UPI00041BCD37|nr:alpha/beta hydrolase [Propionicicella superfundia]